MLALSAPAAHAQATQAPTPPPSVAPSSFASTEVRFSGRYVYGKWYPNSTAVEGPAKIRISYGQPHARGRQVAGKVVPMDSIWRLGANTSTELRTDVDFTLGGTTIPHGVYTLWMLPSANGWQLIVNKEVGQFGTTADYTQSMDLARIPMKVQTLSEPIESLSIYLIPDVAPHATGTPAPAPVNPHGTLKIIWGTTELTTDWALAEWKKPAR